MSARFTKRSKEALKSELTPLQYAVTQENATERPFDNEYDANFEEGIYVDITTGEPLFLSADKFESGCGWPAFSKPIDKALITEPITSQEPLPTRNCSGDLPKRAARAWRRS